jgi:hypothetical protein
MKNKINRLFKLEGCGNGLSVKLKKIEWKIIFSENKDKSFNIFCKKFDF